MARSHIAVAFGAALIAILIVGQLVINLGFPSVDSWHARLDQSYNGAQQDQFVSEKQDGGAGSDPSSYLVGVGKADITGPVVELNMMGYANSSQIGTGLRQRIYSRAFVIGNPSAPSERFVYLVLDTQSGDTAIRNGILEGLAAMGSEYSVYTKNNVAVTGTHSHAGPGAWLNYLLPQITSLGFDKQSYQAIVDGTLLSIKRAHEGLTLGTVSAGSAKIDNANINRSLFAYLANPQAERARYTDDVDKTMTLLKFTRASDGKSIGVLNWFPVHGTSLLGNQTLIAGDNKGVAAYLLEQDMEASATAAPGFVAGFSQANVGDTTPNIEGAYCEDGSNQQCRLNDSTCGGKSQDCHGRGPFYGLNDGGHKSCYEIGKRQYQGAKNLLDSADFTTISGKVRSFHTFVDFSNFTFTLSNGSVVRTCPAAMGNSFAAGTSDGPGAFDFVQNDPGAPSNPFWNIVGSAISPPNAEQKACQYPKPVLLNVGQAKVPYQWSPNIVDIQVLRVGQFVIIVSPGEATTMSGRRWREAVYNSVKSSNIAAEPIVVLGGPANSYTHYIATEEEYGVQRYEGASTLYGQHTLNAYINSTLTYLPYIADGAASPPPAGPTPPDHRDKSISLITGVVYDGAGFGRSYGQVTKDVLPTYARGAIVSATFVGANPRNNLRLEGTFAAIEKQNTDGTWSQVKNDEDWELVYQWKRVNGLTGTSDVTISWDTGITGPAAGTYKIKYYGDAKAVGGKITAFEGESAPFRLA
ncbi:neutral ceramidase precursor [Pyrenophora tritici-repentis]|uniref:Neutral ceramidase n=2 Tax=Pyrenophora tritici-repentis TaxID=45151 RepID=A0A2W1E076_9PLEO|nr:neutral ceramidase precursor [Pyrenophora tritici-repentis Pt-1C-BFP]KAA8623348.1 Neutral ceramidase [Pyrenophora tritici-repentis]EDU45117.1 neutral ceramidase precursor [Pyrenophora tritici-repentis Pt-1C-BFP]KAF7452353.1 Neutral ceramidase [Pyrenophora tritici-repentis]KAF7574525.1 neutral ceramidase precursor [Pyrenophora tritici-repentis]KAG9386693.1 Neutral ceramidase [Pyrenophora tritici-repentis]